MKPSKIFRQILCFLVVNSFMTMTLARAQLLYSFVDGLAPHDVLATIEFAELPATHLDIVALSFTEAGNGIFGFGNDYTGEFDRVQEDTVGFQHDFVGGLVGANFDLGNRSEIYDDNPPWTTVSEDVTPVRFTLVASNVINFPSDVMTLEYEDVTGATQLISRQGTWAVVPESNSTSALFCLASCWMLSAYRYRVRRFQYKLRKQRQVRF